MSSTKFLSNNFFLVSVLAISFFFLKIPKVTAIKDDSAIPLFIDVSEKIRSTKDLNEIVKRSRQVHVNFSLLPLSADTQGTEQLKETLVLNLFEEVEYIAHLEKLESGSNENTSWVGHIEGDENSLVVLTYKQGVMIGHISRHGEIYEVNYLGNDVHVIVEYDFTKFPTESDPIVIDPKLYASELNSRNTTLISSNSNEGNPTTISNDDGSRIDVLVVYTQAARDAEGGTTAIENRILNAEILTNDSYSNSGIFQRINVVHTEMVDYVESGSFATDLDALQDPDDGLMDNVHTLRNMYKADTVALIAEYGGAGIAYVMTSVSPAFAPWAFSVVQRVNATSQYTFAHELGHNMSAHHDWYVDDSVNSPYTYNHGYVNVTDQWRTIMAYPSECSDNGVYCQRIPYWSNPSVTYGGDPMGVPPGTSTACVVGDLSHPDCDADNHLTLNNTAYTVANFRTSSSLHCGTITSDEVWTSDYNVHIVSCDVSVGFGKTLTIEEGVIVKFYNGTKLSVSGALRAMGTLTDPVYFTSYQDDTVGGDTNGDGWSTGSRGDWDYIIFQDTSIDSTSLIDHAFIRFGGYYPEPIVGAVHLKEASPTIQNTIFEENDICALSADLRSFPTLTGNTFQDNERNGLCLRSGTVDMDATWDVTDVSYYLTGDVTVGIGNLLTVAPGVIVKMTANNGTLTVDGDLQVEGTAEGPVYFTSYRDDTIGGDTNGDGGSTGSPGDWNYIEFTDTSDDNTSMIDHAVIRFGGYSSTGAIYLNAASPTIKFSTIISNAFAGISVHSSDQKFVCNNIYSNESYGIYSDSPGISISAIYHWWGDESGPYHVLENPGGVGNAVSDVVEFKPWLTFPCTDTTSFIYLPVVSRQ